MPIYVDPIADWGKKGKWCHMGIDCESDVEELHQFAQSIGLKRAWFQDRPHYPHYDLRPSKRELAVKNGAIEVTSTELIKLTKRPLKGG